MDFLGVEIRGRFAREPKRKKIIVACFEFRVACKSKIALALLLALTRNTERSDHVSRNKKSRVACFELRVKAKASLVYFLILHETRSVAITHHATKNLSSWKWKRRYLINMICTDRQHYQTINPQRDSGTWRQSCF